MNIQELQLLRDELTNGNYAAMSYAEMADAINHREEVVLPNPNPPAQVPRQLTLFEILGTLRAADEAGTQNAIEKVPAILQRLPDDVTRNDRSAMLISFEIIKPYINQAAQDALNSLLAETEDDPEYSADIIEYEQSRAEELFTNGITITTRDIQSALNLAGV